MDKKNTTINYEGVSIRKNWIFNGGFTTNRNGWIYTENDFNYHLYGDEWVNWDGNPSGCIKIQLGSGSYSAGEYAYHYQDFTIQDELNSKMATLSFDYTYQWDASVPDDGVLYMAVIIEGVEKSLEIDMNDLTFNQWTNVRMDYNPVTFGQSLPGDVTIRTGIKINGNCYKGAADSQLLMDNIRFNLWTLPDDDGLLEAHDIDTSLDYSYYSTGYGEGYSFLDVERSKDPTEEIIFTINEDIVEDILDFSIGTVTLNSPAIKIFNSTKFGEEGVFYTFGEFIDWQTEFSIFIPSNYFCWVEVEKRVDWCVTSIIDGFGVNQTESCLGKGYGSTSLIIPTSILGSGLWKLDAISENYINDSKSYVWRDDNFESDGSLTFGEIFKINTVLNDSVSILDTEINCTIYYPNNSVFWHESKIITTHDFNFIALNVGENMTPGEFKVEVIWTNNQSPLFRDQVGYKNFNINIWHHTNISAVIDDFELIAGNPLILKVNLEDIDINSSIDFATVKYNSSFGVSGDMTYQGLGIYFTEINTSSLDTGNYYFSFNYTKINYENGSKIDLIRLKIVSQSLKLEVPKATLNSYGNNYVISQVNVTGAISGLLLWPANVSTDWQNGYSVESHNNGSYSLNFSTYGLPLYGTLETFTIKILSNMTDYESTYDFVSLTIFPIPTKAYSNSSLVHTYIDKKISLKLNYTEEWDEIKVVDPTCNVTWSGIYNISQVSGDIYLDLFTNNLEISAYSAIIELKKPGYAISYLSITVVIFPVPTIAYSNSSLVHTFIDTKVSLKLNYTQEWNGMKIENSTCSVTWSGTYNISQVSGDIYLDLFTNNLEINDYSATIELKKSGFAVSYLIITIIIDEKHVELNISVNLINITEHGVVNVTFGEILNLTCSIYSPIDDSYLSYGNLEFNSENIWENLTYGSEDHYIISFTVNEELFRLGISSVYIEFQHPNYKTTVFSFQILVEQRTINVSAIDFEDTIESYAGEQIYNTINLTDMTADEIVENATIIFSWDFGIGELYYIGDGIYQTILIIPENIKGSYKVDLIISKDGVMYKTEKYSVFVTIIEEEPPIFPLWIIIACLSLIVGILGLLSIRSYVTLPRKRKIESELLEQIQPFKDIRNIQGILVSHRVSGVSIYSRTYSILDEESIIGFSGLIQAITIAGNQFTKEQTDDREIEIERISEDINELDFNIFHALTCDYKELRIVFLLKEKASDRLRKELYILTREIYEQCENDLINFQGKLDPFSKIIPGIINKYFPLFYKDKFRLTQNTKYYRKQKNSDETPLDELKILNIIEKISESEEEFYLETILNLTKHKKENVLIRAIDSLILKKLLIPVDSNELFH